jgi:hypothetical protein
MEFFRTLFNQIKKNACTYPEVKQKLLRMLYNLLLLEAVSIPLCSHEKKKSYKSSLLESSTNTLITEGSEDRMNDEALIEDELFTGYME